MSGRHRLGVALLLDPPVSAEVEGLRRALGDTSLGRVGAHLTLVPPVNVRASDLGEALEVLRRSAAGLSGPLELALGPVATFLPASPVVYLEVTGSGEELSALDQLRGAVSKGPLDRKARWPWVPHVTLADEATPERASAAVLALGSYAATASFDRVVLLEERGRRWWPLADASFGPPSVVGRGGLATDIVEGSLLGPDVLALLGTDATAHEVLLEDLAPAGTSPASPSPVAPAPVAPAPMTPGPAAPAPMTHAPARIVLTGRREGRLVGVATAWREPQLDGPVHAGVVVEAGSRRQGVGRVLLVALESAMRRHGWSPERVRGHGPAGFYAACGAWVQAAEPLVGPGG